MAVDEFGGVIADTQADTLVGGADDFVQKDEFGGIVSQQRDATQPVGQQPLTDEFGGVVSGQAQDQSVSTFDKFVGSAKAFGRETTGLLAAMPRFEAAKSKLFGENLSDLQLDMFEKTGIEIPEGVRNAYKAVNDTFTSAIVNPAGTAGRFIGQAERIPVIKKLNDEIEKFGVSQIKESSAIRDRFTEQKEPIMKLIREGRGGDALEKVGELAISETPRLLSQIIMAYFSRGGSLGYMAQSAAARKYGALAEEDVSPVQRTVNATATGVTEFFSEKLGTGRILDKAFSGKAVKGAANKVKEFMFDAIGGAVSEGVAQVGENALDAMVGMDASLGDGVAEALILGSLFDGGTSIAGQIKNGRSTNKMRDGLVASGATEAEADAIITEAQGATTAEESNEVDKKIGEILGRNKADTNSDVKQAVGESRANEILQKETLSEADNTELDEILEEVDAVTAFEIRKQQEAKNATDTTKRDRADEGIQKDREGQVTPDIGADADGRPPVQATGQERDGVEQGPIANELTEEQARAEAERIGVIFEGMQDMGDGTTQPMFSGVDVEGSFMAKDGQTVQEAHDALIQRQAVKAPVGGEQLADDQEPVSAEKVPPADAEGALGPRMEEGSDSIGISIDRMNARRVELGLEPLGDVEVKHLQESMNNAIKSGEVDKIEKLAIQSALKGDVQFNDEQVMAAGAKLAQLENEIEVLEDQLDSAEDSLDVDAIKAELSNRQLRVDTLMFGLRGAVTPSARAIRAMGAIISKKDYSVKSLLNQATLAKGEPLTDEERDTVTKAAKEVRKAQTNVNETTKKERKAVSKKDKINEILENIRFMKRTITNRSKKPQSKDAKRLAELKKIEKQQDTISELLDVIRKQAVSANNTRLVEDPEGYIDTIANLRKEIRESDWYKTLRKDAFKDKRKAKQLLDLEQKLTELKDQREGKYRNIPEGKEVKVADEDIKALRDSIREIEQLMNVEDQIADLEEQIRTGIFKTEAKKTKPKQSKELTEAKTKLHQLQREAREKIYNLRDQTWRDKLKNWATLPRSLMATADMSYGLRQGLLPSFAHPVIAAKTWGEAFKATFSQNTADELDVAMREDPLFDDMVALGTHFSSMDSAIESRTEFFASNLAEQIPGFGVVVRASERNMVTGINMLRYGIMKDFIAKHPDAPLEAKKAYAKYVNVATGRGEAKFLDKSAEELSLLLFAPRFAVSRVQAPFLAVQNMQHPELRGEMIKQWTAYLGTGMTVLALAKMAGAEVGDDPEDSDFGKIVIGGNKRIDIWGGIQQPMRILAKGVKGGIQRATDGETDVNPIEDVWRFLSYKLSPPVQMVNELLSGEDIIGRETEPIEVSGVELPVPFTVAAKNMTPLIIQSAIEAYNEGENPEVIAALAAGEGLGLSIGVYDK